MCLKAQRNSYHFTPVLEMDCGAGNSLHLLDLKYWLSYRAFQSREKSPFSPPKFLLFKCYSVMMTSNKLQHIANDFFQGF